MIRRIAPFAVVVLALLASGEAAAKIYKCRNAKGEIYYSQTYNAANCAGGGAQLNEQGLAIKQIERQKSAEEIAAEKAEKERLAEQQRQADAAKQADQVLVMSYASAEDLERAHAQELQVIDTSIATTELQVHSQERSLAELLASAAEAERAGRAVPDAVATGIARVRKQIEDQNAFIARKEAEKEGVNRDFEAKLARYKELTAKAPGE
ncbi:MAG TPA: DUF4124 domain-containing protein [Pseudomonadota bacterium]|nr:DUF4124 domain-containing protein [Xanthomonadales bacterium]HQW63278.1 DUF4124 domain-containing protein [Pseudomonadota bacterium]MBP7418184.1 DUF4124 domain-containing protein [Xanthomonadales bacterium]HQX24315.1 DUF4124 domain-containing protein [Pseudomonadota bacterium]HQY36061.1 DUF4124 domain-containing protein [Pseudomonadota bacterium]